MESPRQDAGLLQQEPWHPHPHSHSFPTSPLLLAAGLQPVAQALPLVGVTDGCVKRLCPRQPIWQTPGLKGVGGMQRGVN